MYWYEAMDRPERLVEPLGVLGGLACNPRPQRGSTTAARGLGADAQAERVEADEAGGVALVVDRVGLEGGQVGTVQAVRRAAAGDADAALVEQQAGSAGDAGADVVDQTLQRLALGR